MNYATTAKRPNPLAALGAVGVPATFGVILVLGLAVTATIKNEDGKTQGFFVDVKPEVEPVPPPEITPKTDQSNTPITQIERPASRPMPTPGITLSGDAPLVVGGGLNQGWGSSLEPLGIEIPAPRPTPVFDPINASPRGNPSKWITTADYRSSWIRRDLTGTARFILQIDATGRVSDCTITGSTGHGELDRATCRLVQGRALFNPAKGSDGEVTAGSYSSSVNWSIPE